ncbi:MAG: SEC-C domain-containing protein [Methylomonas sp.]|uniref:YecA family protein n=1 Tax=Methylomonas sp. TaxID=418 RepID=UPI0025FC0B0C|nr:SEC-C metal-binding domain-containing protein [Methylomonas sp.]MCK9607465.1 SEC-C domain-containing protein [Methylomonas sp.]
MGLKKIGRNDPCWCGSGKKYKKCHIDRVNETPIQEWEASKLMRNKFARKLCSAPKSLHKECANRIVKAHTVPKSSSLKAFAKDGHVLGLKISLESFQKYGGKLQPELIGINNASTFTGFCQKHDDQLFSCLEKEAFRMTDKQCFMLAFRSFAREFYTKYSLADSYDLNSSLDKGKPIHRQLEIQELAFLMNVGAEAGVKDGIFHKGKFDRCIANNDYSDVRAVVFKFQEPFPVQVSGSVNPDFDFENKKLQDLSDLEKNPDILSFTSFFDGSNGYIVLSWLQNCHETCKELVMSLINKQKEHVSTYLLQYIFSNFENFFISPDWWSCVSQKDRNKVIEMSHHNVDPYIDPHGNHISAKLLTTTLPDPMSIDYVNWCP